MKDLKNMDTAGKKMGRRPPDPVHDGIALKLRELYSDLESEGIPDDLLSLLDKLDEAERAQQRLNGLKANLDG